MKIDVKWSTYPEKIWNKLNVLFCSKKKRCDWAGNSWFSVVKLNHAQASSWNYLQLWDNRGVRVKCGLCLLSQTHQSVPPELASIIRSGTKEFRERADSRSAQQTLFSFLCFASKEHPLRFVKASLRAVHRHKSIYCTSSSCFHQSPLIHQQVEQDWECINKNMLLYLQYFLFVIQVSSQLRWFYIKPQILSVSQKLVSMNEEERVSVKK